MHTSSLLIVLLFIVINISFAKPTISKPIISPIQPNEDLAAYWTKERMASAIPMDLKVIDSNRKHNISETMTEYDPNAKPIRIEGRAPTIGINHKDTNINILKDGNISDPLYPFPYTDGFAPTYTSQPWNIVGKVFFSSGGLNYVCSGAASGHYLITTAAHCVYNLANGWHSNFIFVPGYNNGVSAYPRFSAYTFVIGSTYYNYETICEDVAAVVLFKSSGYGVGDYVGWFGSLWNGGYSLSWRSLGYPAAAPFNGQLLYWADSALGAIDNSACTPNPFGTGSAATGGSSGGPWVYNFGSGNYINGLNSYKWSNQPYAMYSPYFSQVAYDIYIAGAAITP